MSDTRTALLGMNRSELVQIARVAGLGNLSREHTKEDLVAALMEEDVLPEDALQGHRAAMEKHIQRYRTRLLSQLPGCDGRCTSFGCPDLIVQRCWAGFRRDML